MPAAPGFRPVRRPRPGRETIPAPPRRSTEPAGRHVLPPSPRGDCPVHGGGPGDPGRRTAGREGRLLRDPPPHPQPLSPEGRGEKNGFSPLPSGERGWG